MLNKTLQKKPLCREENAMLVEECSF